MKNILMMGLTLPLPGGSERHIYEISSRMPNCTVLTQKGSSCKNKIELPVIKKTTFTRAISFLLVTSLYTFALILTPKKKYTVIHIHENLTYLLIPLLKLRYKVVVTVHGFQGFKFYDNKFLWFFFGNCLKLADKIVTHGYYETEVLQKVYREVKNIPDGVDLDLYKKINEKVQKKISFVGRIHEQKGISFLLDAFEKISKEFPEYTLEILAKSEGHLYESLRKKHPNKNIIWRGFILDRDTLFADMCSSTLLVYPSMWEAIPWPALLEGLASGRPVIASHLYGMEKIFNDSKDIVLVKPGDSDALAKSIAKLLKDKKLAEEIGKQGKKTASSYDLESMAKELYEYYGE
ncbi:MAG: glycosyltransferase family 4 protein [Nanoarchaeota archaeon]|nr:glycosyltransferase family 4 protein [Nanoarchaeota archaeon]